MPSCTQPTAHNIKHSAHLKSLFAPFNEKIVVPNTPAESSPLQVHLSIEQALIWYSSKEILLINDEYMLICAITWDEP